MISTRELNPSPSVTDPYVIVNLALSHLSRVLGRRLNRTRVGRAGTEPLVDQEVGGVLPIETAPGGAIMR